MPRQIQGFNFGSFHTGEEFDVRGIRHFGGLEKIGLPAEQIERLESVQSDFLENPLTKFLAGTYKEKPNKYPNTALFSGLNAQGKERSARGSLSGAPSAWDIANKYEGAGIDLTGVETRKTESGGLQALIKNPTKTVRDPMNPLGDTVQQVDEGNWKDIVNINNRGFDPEVGKRIQEGGYSRYVGKSLDDLKKLRPEWANQLEGLTQASGSIRKAYSAKRDSGGIAKRVGGLIGPALTLAGIFTGNQALRIAGAGVSGLDRGSRKLGGPSAAQGTPAAATPDANVLGVSVGDLQSYNLKRVEGKQSKSGRLSNVLSKSTGSLV